MRSKARFRRKLRSALSPHLLLFLFLFLFLLLHDSSNRFSPPHVINSPDSPHANLDTVARPRRRRPFLHCPFHLHPFTFSPTHLYTASLHHNNNNKPPPHILKNYILIWLASFTSANAWTRPANHSSLYKLPRSCPIPPVPSLSRMACFACFPGPLRSEGTR